MYCIFWVYNMTKVIRRRVCTILFRSPSAPLSLHAPVSSVRDLVLNAAARFVYSARRTEHVSPLLRELLASGSAVDWVPSRHIHLSLASLAVQRRSISLMGYSELPTSARAFGCNLRRRRYTSRSSVESQNNWWSAAVKVWNSLPPSITSLPSLLQFRKALKTELFGRSYGDDHTATLAAGH